jgi:hypothetical protein
MPELIKIYGKCNHCNFKDYGSGITEKAAKNDLELKHRREFRDCSGKLEFKSVPGPLDEEPGKKTTIYKEVAYGMGEGDKGVA